ncbi:relaxin receptor 2 [Plakobranchus ocellatus]|uniref:Relaxin receptor 2 n=1 Tax=Plakobranchus ocellatus TaxID=259542 RepID=A0AAV4A8T6_9GAST|nr:relaxin receptor 2 [Plakobranchus ocellatus]
MGLYLLVIGVHDAKFRGYYLIHDQAWRNSWACDASGVLSTLSTEMSVLTLCIITLDRYISIMYPLSFRRRGLKLARAIMAFTWMLCLALAALPVMGLTYFGNAFYRDNAVCIPLHLHKPRATGWEYSSFLFLGLNLGSFAFIAYAYVAMFYSIHMSALPLRTSRDSKERCLAKRFFFIIITDFVCWIPIIAIKISALSGVNVSNDLYAWVIVFILPVNSALNPLLYTLTTKLFKKQLLTKFTSVVFRPSGRQRERAGSAMTSSSSLQVNATSVRCVNNVEMELLRKYDLAELYRERQGAAALTHNGSDIRSRPDGFNPSKVICGSRRQVCQPHVIAVSECSGEKLLGGSSNA